jgi:hypothetical protein
MGISLVPKVDYVHQQITVTDSYGFFHDIFSVELDCKKALNEHVSIMGGLAFSLNRSGPLDDTGLKFKDEITNTTVFSIPIGITLKW